MRRFSALLALLFAVAASPAEAGDFRVETKIYNADEERPLSENLTLFRDGIVYDYLTEPKMVTIFRPPIGGKAGSFIVLDPSRSVKMQVTTDQIEGLLSKLRAWAADQKDPFLSFLAEPNFTEQSTPDGKSLTLSSEHMTYRIRAMQPSDAAAIEAYRQFSDWYARFNTRGGMLPFPRLAVNEALYRRRQVPTEVVLEIPGQKLKLRAEHRVNWLLSKQDRKMIDQTLEQKNSFLSVDADEFLRAPSGRVAGAAETR